MRTKNDIGSVMSVVSMAPPKPNPGPDPEPEPDPHPTPPKPPERWGRAVCKVRCYPARDQIEASAKPVPSAPAIGTST